MIGKGASFRVSKQILFHFIGDRDDVNSFPAPVEYAVNPIPTDGENLPGVLE